MGHAYLVAAHHQMQLLQILLHLIDDERNEIYLHVDKKCKEFMKEEQFIKIRTDVNSSLKDVLLNKSKDILNEENIKNIVDIMLSDTINRLKEKEIFLDYDKELNKFIADKNENLSFGARPIRRIITREIEDKLSDEMLKGEIKRGDRLSVCFKDDELIFSHK